MWLITLRDLQWRRRRFGIAIGATALVFAMALVIAGIAASFRAEAVRTVRAVGADAWVTSERVTGPFTNFASIPASQEKTLATDPGVREADPLIVLRQTYLAGGKPKDVTLIGFRADGLGMPPVARGRPPRATHEIAVDSSAGFELGRRFVVGSTEFSVVGVTEGLHFFAGLPAAYVPLSDAQEVAFGGGDFVTAFVTKGVPTRSIPGLKVTGNENARQDLMRPLLSAIQTIDLCQLLLWVVAAAIIGSVVYLSALERVRDFAVLKATGASTRSLYAGLALQAVIVSIVAGALAVGIARAIGPMFPLAVEIPSGSYALLPGVALLVGILASFAGLRRTASVDPAVAFGAP
jgi:putative ABC transport system permease protein